MVCLCEGKRGDSIDEVFINKLMRMVKVPWIRPEGSNIVRAQSCGGRSDVIKRMPNELKVCLNRGGDTTLMVWADCDDTCADGDALKATFWKEAERQGITKAQFDTVVFVFAKDRLEKWIEFLQTGNTDEAKEGPRVKHNREVADAAKKLAELCKAARPAALMYRRRPHLISKGERVFWHPLYRAVRGKYRIFCKVRLLDVVEPACGRREARRLSGSIGRYHVDFVLCDPETTEPMLVIELDDRSHQSPQQTKRDRFKDEVLAVGGVPIYRVPAQQAYDPIELADEIARRILTTGANCHNERPI